MALEQVDGSFSDAPSLQARAAQVGLPEVYRAVARVPRGTYLPSEHPGRLWFFFGTVRRDSTGAGVNRPGAFDTGHTGSSQQTPGHLGLLFSHVQTLMRETHSTMTYLESHICTW